MKVELLNLENIEKEEAELNKKITPIKENIYQYDVLAKESKRQGSEEKFRRYSNLALDENEKIVTLEKEKEKLKIKKEAIENKINTINEMVDEMIKEVIMEGIFMDFDYKKYTSYFTDGEFWEKMKDVAKKVGLKTTSYALILYYVLKKDGVPLTDKMLITGSLGYFILPIDLIPDFIPIAGYTDDVAGMLFAIKKCMNYVDDEIKENVSDRLISWFNVERDYVDNLLKDI